MVLKVQFSVDWSSTNTKRKVWQPHQKAKNSFKGSSIWETSKINSINFLRLSVLPHTESIIPKSFSITEEPNWRKEEQTKTPLRFEWQQSLPGRFDLYFRLAQGIKCYGLGERFSGLNIRGEKHTMVSTDNPIHDESADSLYKAVPFLLVGQEKEFYALYLDTPAPCRFHLDNELTEEGHIELFTRRGFRVYLIGPGSLAEIVKGFTSLVGRAKLPPLWSLGHQQSRFSYPDEESVQEVAKEFRKRKIPCDTMVIDIDYMEGYRVFTVSKERFPNFQKLTSDLARDNFKVVSIVDPGVKEDTKFRLFTEGLKNSYFCKTPDGKLFLAEVWPGPSAFPDFFKAEVRQWWAQEQKFLTDAGVAGIWNDMNEPSFFGKTQVLPDNILEMPPAEEQWCMHETEEGIAPHFEVRNLYGLLMSEASYKGLLSVHPNERPFVLTRSGCAGIQRYAAVWLGDNRSWYQHLQKSIPMLLNLGLSGMAFAGVDIGGFAGDTLPELLVRWYEAGIFYPFFRNHCGLTDRGQEAFAFTPQVENMVRRLVEVRYSLLPYIRNLFWEHMHNGAPLMRPLSWHYGEDEIASDIDDQFMFGNDILVAPIMERAREYRPVYLPAGNWYGYETNEKFVGKRTYTIKFPLGTVPAFIREGAIIPTIELMQHTNEYHSKSIVFKIFGEEASCAYFEDDGISFDYEKGAYNEYQISYKTGKLNSKTIKKDYMSQHKYFYQKLNSNDLLNTELS